ncbi:dethiobiotin synthase [Bacillus methanolicus PB1]|uniref:ATP-dependent dethiobiotin synthetase BioD n=1 Tax=Bacillus methanolicus PB1 TaxID=997296 RepID=I3DV49_BACMT|nr:dethiobiotin synthase [Bacillus methanolicus]EIJ78120.1 dethiobiotin synthase [Bacillus methanolicus PB1]
MGSALFITGTGTEIGKTVVSSFLHKVLSKNGLKVKVFKPIQSGFDEEKQIYPDSFWFQKSIGDDQTGMYFFKPAVSPHLAEKLTGQKANIEHIKQKLNELKEQYDLVLVEGAGGLAVPLQVREHELYMTKDFIKELQIPVVLVSLCGLGSIHHAVTTAHYAMNEGLEIKGFVFNQFNDQNFLHMDNVSTIQKLTELPVIAKLPYFENVLPDLDEWISKHNFNDVIAKLNDKKVNKSYI